MNQELEALIRAYDAAAEASAEDATRLNELFSARLDEALAARPRLDRQAFMRMLRHAHRQWLRAQSPPPSLPPRA